MNELITLIVGGLTIGSVYAMVALGFNYIYAVSGVVNFAQGVFVMLGALLGWLFVVDQGMPLVVGLLAAVCVPAVVGLVLERFVIRPYKRGDVLGQLLLTLGAAIFLTALVGIVFGVHPKYMKGLGGALTVGFVSISWHSVLVIGVLLTVAAGSIMLLTRSFLGSVFRASCDDPYMASLLGVNVKRTIFVGYALSGALGGLAGFIIGPVIGVTYDMGMDLAIKGFIAATVGGFGNPVGGLIAGLALGLLEVGTAYTISSSMQDIATLSVLLVILLVRPSGIFGDLRKEATTL